MTVKIATKREEKHEEFVAQQECCHHWIIEMAAGPTSKGICEFCGMQKKYKNYLSDCLEVDEEKYEEWLRKQRYDKEKRKPEEAILPLTQRR